MSTTFGVFVKIKKNIKTILSDIDKPNENIVEIAFRSSNGFHWTNKLAPLLPNKIKVYALDNVAQGIKTIGDIKKAIKKQS